MYVKKKKRHEANYTFVLQHHKRRRRNVYTQIVNLIKFVSKLCKSINIDS